MIQGLNLMQDLFQLSELHVQCEIPSSSNHNVSYMTDNQDNTISSGLYDQSTRETAWTDYTDPVIENTTYTPFGALLSGGTMTRFGYEAKEQSVLGDTDFDFRKYLPQYAFFAQPDTMLGEAFDPQKLNRYAFERNNPYLFTDPTGHQNIYVGGSGGSNTPGAVSNEPQKWLASYLLGKELQKQTRENLYRELQEKYDPVDMTPKSYSRPPEPERMSFEELQQMEMQQEMSVDIDGKGNIVGYTYNGVYTQASTPEIIGEYLAQQGFDKGIVSKEVQKHYKSRTGNSYSVAKAKNVLKSVSYFITDKLGRLFKRTNIGSSGYEDSPA
jgi:RHS repeat-associated protein